MLTEDERLVLSLLASAWNVFQKLPIEHPADAHDFMHAIHQAQLMILARPVRRELHENRDGDLSIPSGLYGGLVE